MQSQNVNVAFTTMGCPKNEADTNRMEALVASSCYKLVDDVCQADVVVVNTCAFLTAATEESLSTIFAVLEDQSFIDREAKLVVTGCMPSRFGEDLKTSLYEASAFIPADKEDDILEVIEELTGVAPSVQEDVRETPLRFATSASAYVKISDGCDRFCSFCTIPYIRGRYHSRSLEEIDSEVSHLVSQGVLEVILIGQDTGIWGSDLIDKPDLANLLDTLATSYPSTWFRVMYLQPEGLTDHLLGVMATHSNICDYLDIPLQHASARIISEMNRKGSGDSYLKILEHVRQLIPDICVRTTLICGFPGETREDMATLTHFVEDARFDYAGVFVYSQEDGTRAGARIDQVPLRTRRARTQRMRDLCDTIGFQKAAENVDRVVDVLVEGYEDEGDKVELVGRYMGQAPEVDGVVHLPDGSAEIGQIVKVRLTESFCYDYDGEVIV